jgi:hypothetical protein
MVGSYRVPAFPGFRDTSRCDEPDFEEGNVDPARPLSVGEGSQDDNS